MKGIRAIILLILMGCLQSCVYETDLMSFVDVIKPEAGAVSKITLSAENDSIIIFGPTMFTYNVETYGLKFNAAEVLVLDTKNTYSVSAAGFSVNPSQKDSAWFDLKINFYMGTGSGSIADKLNAENYVGSRTWKVKYIDLKTYNFKLQHRINADGILEILWIKPPGTTPSIGIMNKYIHRMNLSRLSGDTLIYVDSMYCGGGENYDLGIKLGETTYDFHGINVNYPFPEITFSDTDLDSCLVSLTPSPIKRINRILISDKVVYSGSKSSFKMAQIKIDETQYVVLNCYAIGEKSFLFTEYHTWLNRQMGITAYYRFSYVPGLDLFYISKGSTYPAIEKATYPMPVYEYDQQTFVAEYHLYTTNDGSMTLGSVYSKIVTFDKYMNQTSSLTVPDTRIHEQLTDNKIIGYYNSGQYFIKNYTSDKSWSDFSVYPHYNDSTKMEYSNGLNLTSDGHYLNCRGDYGYYLYDVSDHKTAKLVYTAPKSEVYNIIGNPMNVNELVISGENKIEVRSCPGFQLLKRFQGSGLGTMIINNIDPYSNCLLATSSYNLHIINLNTMQEVLRLKTAYIYQASAKLYRKQIFINNNIVDLTKYIP